MIEVHKVTKKYGSLVAVHEVSFSVRQGEILGLLGPNGAGKTSLLRMLTGYHYPYGGSVRIDGVDIVEHPVASKATIGYLPESPPLYAELSVVEYLQFIARSRAVPDVHVAVESVIEKCSLEEVAFQSISTLSKGYGQRVGLAQAIIHDPKIVILDEPTNGLDPNQIIEIRDIISDLGKTKTVIFSSHIMQEVEAVCNRVIILHTGSIVAEGSMSEITKQLRQSVVYTLVVKGRVTKTALKRAEGIKSMLSIKSEAQGRSIFHIECTAAEEIAEDIFDWVLAHNYKLLELSPKHTTLEEVFTKLTQEEL